MTMVRPAFATPLALHVRNEPIESLSEAQFGRLGAVEYAVRFGACAAGWVWTTRGHRLVVDDGVRAANTVVASVHGGAPAPTLRGDAAMAIAGKGDIFAEVSFEGGRVRSYAWLPGGPYVALAEVAGGVAALGDTSERIVVFERAPASLRPRAAFAAVGASTLRSAAGGRALLVGYEQAGALEVWWLDGAGGARVVARFEGLDSSCLFECVEDVEEGVCYTRPDEPWFWSDGTVYAVIGLEALAGADLSRFAAAPAAPLPEHREGREPPSLPTLAG